MRYIKLDFVELTGAYLKNLAAKRQPFSYSTNGSV
ncbi:hypothetical protein QFZ72_005986 [Bacillus sp. V2I10]|nr:hypothetical protein [Bacillus sp. V2I10]